MHDGAYGESNRQHIARSWEKGDSSSAVTLIMQSKCMKVELDERAADTNRMRVKMHTAANFVERQRNIIISWMHTVLELNHYHEYMPIEEKRRQDYA